MIDDRLLFCRAEKQTRVIKPVIPGMSEQQESDPDQSGGSHPVRSSQHELTQSYLLRLWLSSEDGHWRASLQSVRTGERHMFADLDSLFVFLYDQVRSRPE
jgi:hypothetical protein